MAHRAIGMIQMVYVFTNAGIVSNPIIATYPVMES
jgi:hypothetical protein